MMSIFQAGVSSNYIMQALVATLITWGVTALGGASVFVIKKFNNNLLSLMFGFGAGVMLAASFFSLLLPAITMAEELNQNVALMISVGFIIGCLLIFIIDLTLPHLHIKQEEPEGPRTALNRKILLVLSITLHNITQKDTKMQKRAFKWALFLF